MSLRSSVFLVLIVQYSVIQRYNFYIVVAKSRNSNFDLATIPISVAEANYSIKLWGPPPLLPLISASAFNGTGSFYK